MKCELTPVLKPGNLVIVTGGANKKKSATYIHESVELAYGWFDVVVGGKTARRKIKCENVRKV